MLKNEYTRIYQSVYARIRCLMLYGLDTLYWTGN